jgi:hypothetical protein
MAIIDRVGWLRRSGIARDSLDAMAILKAAGEWPSEEEMGMVNGRALSRMTRMDWALRRRREAAPVSEGRLPVGEVPRGKGLGRRKGGRRDRLAKHY